MTEGRTWLEESLLASLRPLGPVVEGQAAGLGLKSLSRVGFIPAALAARWVVPRGTEMTQRLSLLRRCGWKARSKRPGGYLSRILLDVGRPPLQGFSSRILRDSSLSFGVFSLFHFEFGLFPSIC